jgi:hypothetical protein
MRKYETSVLPHICVLCQLGFLPLEFKMDAKCHGDVTVKFEKTKKLTAKIRLLGSGKLKVQPMRLFAIQREMRRGFDEMVKAKIMGFEPNYKFIDYFHNIF